MKKFWEYQNKIEKRGSEFIEKNIKHLRMIPKIIVFFGITYYHSLFISYRIDMYVWLIITISFALFVFFFPFSKYFKLEK